MNRRSFVKGLIGIAATAFAGPVMASVSLANDIPITTNLRSFSDMLNEYMPYELLKEEFMKKDYLINHVHQGNWGQLKIGMPT